MIKSKFFAGVMTAAMVMGSLTLPETISMDGIGAISVQAAEVVDSGTCGDNLTWVLDDEGTLTISGTGEMKDYVAVLVDSTGTTEGEDLASPWYMNENIIAVVIENGVTGIGNYAFLYCTNLTTVEMANSITSIGDRAFYGCESLTNIDIPDSVTSIGVSAFCECSSLISIEIPNGVTSIENYTFTGCTSLTNVEIPNSVTYIGAWSFSNCTSLSSIKIPDSVVSIVDHALGYYSGTSVDYPTLYQIDGFIIYGNAGTAAETYAEENGFTFLNSDDVSSSDGNRDANGDADGDANGDGTVDYLDAMNVLRYDAEIMELTDAQLKAADVNGDGSVDSLDAILILRYDAGLIDSFE